MLNLGGLAAAARRTRADFDADDQIAPDLSAVGSAIGELARAKMLNALMGGRALTATELALEAGVTPSTASSHLERLLEAGLIARTAQGRHRYFRIAAVEIAGVLESLMGLTTADRKIRTGPRSEALRRARVCYDHLAGEFGVRLLDRIRERQFVRGDDQSLELTAAGENWVVELGVDVDRVRRAARPMVRSCLDWSERRSHLSGALGAAILERLFALRFARRDSLSRAVLISPRGETFLASVTL